MIPTRRTVLFLDIDGVLNIPEEHDLTVRRERWFGQAVYPVPCASLLLRGLSYYFEGVADRFTIAWLSTWGERSHLWHDWSGAVSHYWPIAFPLSAHRLKFAQRTFPEHADPNVTDRKLLAVRYFMLRYPRSRLIWVEDGFATETVAWAKMWPMGARLVDTTSGPARDALLSTDEGAARRFVDQFLNVG